MADSDFDINENNGGALVSTSAIFLTLTWISVILRTYTRAYLTNSFKLDDWLMIVSLVSSP